MTETLRRLDKAATPGPWTWKQEGPDGYLRDANGRALACDMQYYPWCPEPNDMELIAAMRNALPDLLADADTLREQGRREVLAEIAKIEEFNGDCGHCAFCDVDGPSGTNPPHLPDCLWLRAQQVTP